MRRWLLSVGTCSVFIATLAACSGSSTPPTPGGHSSATQPSVAQPSTSPISHGSLTDREFSVARAIARHEANMSARWVSSASALAIRGDKPLTGNLGHPCAAGPRLSILLIGRFNIATTGTPGAREVTVRTVGITADPVSGKACLIGVGTEHESPDPRATILFTHKG